MFIQAYAHIAKYTRKCDDDVIKISFFSLIAYHDIIKK